MTKTFTDIQIRIAIERARQAAKERFDADFAATGDQWGPCGFAWVVVKPANSKLAKILVKEYGAQKHWKGGVSVWSPGARQTQNMDLKENAAYAFASTLRNLLGLDHDKVYSESRMD